jgi:hypothetical protein
MILWSKLRNRGFKPFQSSKEADDAVCLVLKDQHPSIGRTIRNSPKQHGLGLFDTVCKLLSISAPIQVALSVCQAIADGCQSLAGCVFLQT